ncbi:hypothetical protein FOFC_09061, partial [Fusarium oxysporum]
MVSLRLWGLWTMAITLVSALPNLRIMPLGDSITKGSGSSGTVGYRGPLRQKLLSKGANDDITVDMIGTLSHGNMVDNNHEGHSGEYLADINRYWKQSIEARPNVVLVHAGTNNMDKNRDLDIALDLMTSIIDGVFQSAPDATILVAPVIWANKPAMQANTDRFNPQVRELIKLRQTQGKHILPVEIDITVSDLSDLKHPNDRGYEKMANAWLEAILEADSRGWLKDPVKRSPSDYPGMGLGWSGGGDNPVSGPHTSIWEKRGTVFEGFRTWESVGTILGAVEFAANGNILLADLNGDSITDYVITEDDGTVRAWINGGKANDWTSIGKVNPAWDSIKGDMIRLADVDNDGKADMIVLYSDGAAKVWKNTDNGKKFTALDAKWATGLASRDKVLFEDIDGDGYADYVIMESNGATKWARNTHNNGKDASKKNWEAAKSIAPGPVDMPPGRARLRDIDGDGKADYLIVYEGGAVKALRNTLGDGERNWDDLGTIAPGISGVTGNMIRFADMDGDGLADFLAVGDDGSIRMWKNLGIVGGKGQSMRFADLTGDGKDDIISVDAKGRARAWINKGVDKWEAIGEIAPGFDEDLSSARIEFADVNGDKKADYLIIYGGGSVKAYLNNGNLPNPDGKRIWQNGIVISPGVGEPGSKVRFADLDGDGYADFLIVYDGGAVKYWQNNQNIPPKDGERIWKDGIIVATGVGEPGSKVRFADLTGDGKADYIIQYDGGAARGYRNNGNIPKGSGRKWNDMGTIAGGVSPQGPVRYADLNGDGKADYLVTFGGGAVNAYINNYDWKRPLPGEDSDDKDDNGGNDDDPNNDENECNPAPKTYSEKPIDRVGDYMDWDNIERPKTTITGWQYVTIVNLTPHRFKYDVDGSHSYQMTHWDFGDIPQGKARQNAVEYSSSAGSKVDSKGEAYYNIDGTKDKFVVRVTNHENSIFPKRIVFDLNDMGAGSREYYCPQEETPVTLVITGSADYKHGYITSLVHGKAGWMQSIKSVIEDRRLDQIVMPGTHDSGISKITNGLLSLGSAKNTQTQNLNINGQLKAGARWFDLRIASIHKPGNDNYDFWAVHVNEERGEPAIGGSGEKLNEVIEEINAFTSESPGEVIILQVRALMGLYQSPRGGPIYWDDGLKEDFFDKLREINYRCTDLKRKDNFESMTVGSLMDANKGKGCVLIFLNTDNLEEKIEKEDRISEKDGIYHKDSMKWTEAWPQKKHTKDAAEWSIDAWKKRDERGMHVAQWLVTPNYPLEIYSLLQIAVLPTNPALYWRGVSEITPELFPNVLMIDYIGNVILNVNEPEWDELSAEMQVLAIGLNLYMISENCDINEKRPPLLPDSSKAAKLASGGRKGFSSWNGVVFANGTRFDKAPPGLRLGCAETLPKGTVFAHCPPLMSRVEGGIEEDSLEAGNGGTSFHD